MRGMSSLVGPKVGWRLAWRICAREVGKTYFRENGAASSSQIIHNCFFSVPFFFPKTKQEPRHEKKERIKKLSRV